MPTAQQTAAKWASRTKAAVPEYRQGIAETTKDPMALAANAADKWLNRVSESKDRFVAGLSRVSAQDWKDQCLNVGANRIGAGVDAAAPQMVPFFEALDAHQSQINSKLASMQDVTFEDSLERMRVQATMMRDFSRR